MWLIEALMLAVGGGLATYVALRFAMWGVAWARKNRQAGLRLELGGFLSDAVESFRGFLGDWVDRVADDPTWQHGDSHHSDSGYSGGSDHHGGPCDGGGDGGMCS